MTGGAQEKKGAFALPTSNSLGEEIGKRKVPEGIEKDAEPLCRNTQDEEN